MNKVDGYSYARHGFEIRKAVLSEDQLTAIYNRAINYINETLSKGSNDLRAVNFSDDKINSFHALHEDPVLMDLYKNTNLLEIASELLEDDVEIRGAELFAKPAGVGLASPWHQDNFYWCLNNAQALTIWIAVAPSAYLNGGVMYVPSSHLLGTLDHEDSNAPGSSQTIRKDLLDQILLTQGVFVTSLARGDCAIHHSNTIHGSSPNSSNFPRTGLTLQVKAKSDTYNSDMKKHYESRLFKQINDRAQKG